MKPYKSGDMTRQDTSAIVDAVMADVIGGGFSPQSESTSADTNHKPDSPHDNKHA